MDKEPREGDSDYDVFYRDISSLEVVEEHAPGSESPEPPKKRNKLHFTRPSKRAILTTIGLVVVLGMLTTGAIFIRKSSPEPQTSVVINTQSLDNGTLNQLTPTDGGEVKQQLTISPDTLFKNNVDIQKSATIGEDLTVAGKSIFQGITTMADSLNVGRSLSVGGAASIGNSLSVNGQISAASMSVGSLTISSINLSSDLTFAGHLIPNGGAPSARPSVATSGGSVSVSGNDTAGTVTITIGGGQTLAGEMAIVTFGSQFNRTPKVQLTPVTSAASSINYYATRSAGFFTVDTSTKPSNGAVYVFDYLVTQ